MITHHAGLDQLEEVEKKRLSRERIGYKLAKGRDCGNHQTAAGISYAEYHTNKLNSQRPFDRPYGNKEYAQYRNRKTGRYTYSAAEFKAWLSEKVEVYAYDAKATLTTVWNPTAATRAKFDSVGVKLEYKYS